ncbi:MAG: BMP family protein [Candidatus Bathyarchaeia archaeon]
MSNQSKNMKTIAALVIVIIVVIAGAAYYLTQAPPAQSPVTMTVTETTSAAGITTEQVKIAMILPGRIDDLGWNQPGYESFTNLLTSYNEGINTCGCWVQNHEEKAQIQADVRDFVSKGYQIIIGHGFEFQVPMQELAPQYPDVSFLVIGGWNNSLPNLAIADVRTDQTGYVLGYLAGKMTLSNKIGYIMGARVAELARFEPNFAKGASDANPSITYSYGALPGGGNGILPGGSISVVAVGDFHDLQGAKADAELMASQNVDVLAVMGDGVVRGAIEGAIDKNIKLIGNGVNIADAPPVGGEKLVLGSGSWKWDAVMKAWLADVSSGKRNGKYWADFTNGGIEVELNKDNVPSAVQQDVLSVLDKVKSGSITTDPLGPLMVGNPLAELQTNFIALVLQHARE